MLFPCLLPLLLIASLVSAVVPGDFAVVGGMGFFVEKHLATGSSGVDIFKVHHIPSGKLYVLKEIFLKDRDDDPYTRETTIFNRLKGQDRAVQMVASEMVGMVSRIVIEFGTSDLLHFLTTNPQKYSIHDLWPQMVLAVEQLHAQDVIHLDIKPENMLLVGDYLKLFDFDISRFFEDEEQDFVLLDFPFGTPEYQSPESVTPLLDGSFSFGKEADIWGLGAVLYELVYGYPPLFEHPDVDSKMACLRNPDCLIPFAAAPHSDLQLFVPIIQACLQRDYAARPTIQQLKQMSIDAGINFAKHIAAVPPSFSTQIAGYPSALNVRGELYGVGKVFSEAGEDAPSYMKVVNIHTGRLYTMAQMDLSTTEINEVRDEVLNDIAIHSSFKNPSNILSFVQHEQKQQVIRSIFEYANTTLEHHLLTSKIAMDLSKVWHDMLLAVHEVHQGNVIHFLPSPRAFWLSLDGTWKIADFRLARKVSTSQPFFFTDSPVGDEDFYAPEAAIESMEREGFFKFTKQNDVWVLGVSLYQLIYDGRLPFAKYQTLGEKLGCIADPECEIDYPFPSNKDHSRLVDAVKACLRRNPMARPSISQLIEHVTGRSDSLVGVSTGYLKSGPNTYNGYRYTNNFNGYQPKKNQRNKQNIPSWAHQCDDEACQIGKQPQPQTWRNNNNNYNNGYNNGYYGKRPYVSGKGPSMADVGCTDGCCPMPPKKFKPNGYTGSNNYGNNYGYSEKYGNNNYGSGSGDVCTDGCCPLPGSSAPGKRVPPRNAMNGRPMPLGSAAGSGGCSDPSCSIPHGNNNGNRPGPLAPFQGCTDESCSIDHGLGASNGIPSGPNGIPNGHSPDGGCCGGHSDFQNEQYLVPSGYNPSSPSSGYQPQPQTESEARRLRREEYLAAQQGSTTTSGSERVVPVASLLLCLLLLL